MSLTGENLVGLFIIMKAQDCRGILELYVNKRVIKLK